MKLLFDQNVSYTLCERLKDIFPGSTQVRLAGLDRATDFDIWQFAQAREFTIATLDSDFADLVGLRGYPPKVIWLRCGNQPTTYVETLLRHEHARIQAMEKDADTGCLELY